MCKSQEREALGFEVAYSLCYEKMMYKFYGRVDKLSSFLLLVSGASIIATSIPDWVLGLFVAIISGLQFVYAPGQKYQAAKTTHNNYYELYTDMSALSDTAIRERLKELSKEDTDPIGLLSHPARLAALLMLGYTRQTSEPAEREMTFFERAFSVFTGECPYY